MNTLHANGLLKRYGRKTVLDGLDLVLEPGAVTVLLGRNGAGKSTFMKLALGVLRPDAGTIRVAGLDPARRARDVRRAVGYVPDRPDVYDWMTPRELFSFLAPQYPSWNAAVADRIAGDLGVPLDGRFGELSRGEGMKAMLAAALAPEPALLLLDEPFGGLDAVAREDVLRGVIGELSGVTVLCATHDLDVAARIADHVVLLNHGRAEMRPADEPAPERLRELLAGAV
jgi:ABC-2 type transport system ATP-binding protein